MISFSQNNKQYVIHKSNPNSSENANTPTEQHISTRSYHFYRIKMTDNLDADEINLKEKTNFSNNSNYLPENNISINTPSNIIADIPEIKQLDISLNEEEKNAIYKLLLEPDIENAPFVEIKIWALEHFIIKTGLALDDVLNIHIGDIDFHSNSCIIHPDDGTTISIYLHSELIPILKIYLNRREGTSADYLFCNERGEKLDSMLCKNQALRYGHRRGVPDISIDELRYLFV